MSNRPEGTFERFNTWASRSVTLKLLVIGFLILLLLIPASMLDDLIYERLNLRDQAQEEVSSKWGGQQTLGGPVVSVPYTYRVASPTDEDPDRTVARQGYAHFLPEDIAVSGELTPEERYRGIYVVVLYNTVLRMRGSFADFNTDALNLPAGALRWDKALLSVGISDMTGVNAAITAQLGSRTLELGPGIPTGEVFASGASVPVDLSTGRDRLDFDFTLDLNGSGALYFRPFGKQTTVDLRSSWSAPSFAGTFLPETRTVSDDGFTAGWEVLHLNRNYPQQGLGNFLPGVPQGQDTYVDSYREYDYQYAHTEQAGDRFGVKLLLPVDEYKKTQRSTKFAVLFIFITFLTFFFIEVLNRKRLHPIQYLLIGAAIVLFYVLLLSFSEHIPFNAAYWICSAVIVGLITTYSYFALRNGKLTTLVAAMLLVCYVFFFSLLQLEDYALLLGSIGLLLILGTIMYLTRNIDWYALQKGEVPSEQH